MESFDLSVFSQATWLISRGRNPFVTLRGVHILGDHFSAILYLIAPLYRIWSDPRLLLVMQSATVGIGALPVYYFAKDRLKSTLLALFFGICYLLYPPIGGECVREFHPDTLATTPFLASILFIERRKLFIALAMLALAGMCKENAGFVVGAFGISLMAKSLILSCKQKRSQVSDSPDEVERTSDAGKVSYYACSGLRVMTLGLVLIVASFSLNRYFNGGQASGYATAYEAYGKSPSQIIGFLFSHPIRLFDDLNRPDVREFLYKMCFPLAFLPILSPELLLVGTPPQIMFFLSKNYYQKYDWCNQYFAFVNPFFFMAAIVGFTRFRSIGGRTLNAVVVLCMIALCISEQRKMPYLNEISDGFGNLLTSQRASSLRSNISRYVPEDASVSTVSSLSATLSCRRVAYTFPNPFVKYIWGTSVAAMRELDGETQPELDVAKISKIADSAPVEYVLIRGLRDYWLLDRKDFQTVTALTLSSRRYGIVFCDQDLIILKKGADHQDGIAQLVKQTKISIRDEAELRVAIVKWLFGG